MIVFLVVFFIIVSYQFSEVAVSCNRKAIEEIVKGNYEKCGEYSRRSNNFGFLHNTLNLTILLTIFLYCI